MAEVFISYSSIDSVKAFEIVDQLEATGINCWLSQRNIPPGADYAIEIPKAITASDYFVLLLTNAAQNSPYVMLELDQAFKQKKEIIPIQLEQLLENEKTNFFLNAKQKVDATQNLTAAVNDIIRRIRPTASKTRSVAHQGTKSVHEHLNPIRCPRCGGEVLKQMEYPRFGKGIDVKDGEITKPRYVNWKMEKSRHMIYFRGFILAVSIFCFGAVAVFAVASEPWVRKVFGLVAAFCVGVIARMYCSEKEEYDELLKSCSSTYNSVLDKAIRMINNSGLKCWTLKCAKCEEEFSILLPKEESLNDRVVTLLRDEKSDNHFLKRNN